MCVYAYVHTHIPAFLYYLQVQIDSILMLVFPPRLHVSSLYSPGEMPQYTGSTRRNLLEAGPSQGLTVGRLVLSPVLPYVFCISGGNTCNFSVGVLGAGSSTQSKGRTVGAVGRRLESTLITQELSTAAG